MTRHPEYTIKCGFCGLHATKGVYNSYTKALRKHEVLTDIQPDGTRKCHRPVSFCCGKHRDEYLVKAKDLGRRNRNEL